MKNILIVLAILFFVQPIETPAAEKSTLIIEVAGDLSETKKHLEIYHPFIKVLHTYELIFNGIAIEGKSHHLEQISELQQVKAVHPVQEYRTLPFRKSDYQLEPINLHPETIPYTGKGVNVAVIDTGMDYTHLDLQKNYHGGYDVFDMDDNPMETLPHEGLPTEHGTHVAGIIAANGKMRGVAPDANIFAYRALGPGGFGTSVHILAALEQAVIDGADIINLSLGNSVNGPDYPTSVAVNKAADLGIAVVIANGNSGPDLWTVGSPATASQAIAVGAAQGETTKAFLYNHLKRKSIPLKQVPNAVPWNLQNDYQLTTLDSDHLKNKIVLIKLPSDLLSEQVLDAQEKGAAGIIISENNTAQQSELFLNPPTEKLETPLAVVSHEDGDWLSENMGSYLENHYETIAEQTADFSSRGPVTINWEIKPDIIAPGTDVYSTVPGGYQAFSGTSMAAPYVTGVLALLKEAHPDWSPQKMFHVLKTTAQPFQETESSPTSEGNGLIQPELAIHPESIISDPSLHFGKLTKTDNERQIQIRIENTSAQRQTYAFSVPKQAENYRIDVPLSFSIEPNEEKEVTISLKASQNLADGLYEGYIHVTEIVSGDDIYLPYLFINQAADQPKHFGFELTRSPLENERYQYQIYTTESLAQFSVQLYDPDTLAWRGELFQLTDPKTGINKGDIPKENINPGVYTAQITAVTVSGEVETLEMTVHLE